MTLHLKFYVSEDSVFIPSGFKGATRLFVIWIKKSERDNTKLLNHELVHVKQFWRTLGLHGLLYRFSTTYQMNAECEAYATQYKPISDNDILWWAKTGMKGYAFYHKTTLTDRINCVKKWRGKV